MVCRARSIQTLFRRVYIDSLNVIGMRRMSTVVVPFCKRVRRGTGNEANMLHDDARLGNDGTADRTRAVWTHSPPASPRSLPWPAVSRWVLGSGGDTPWTPGRPAGRHPAPRAHVRFSIADMLRRVRHACTRTWACQPPPVPILNVPIKARLWRSLSTVVQIECLYSHFMKTPNLCGPRSRLYDECVG